MYQRNKKDSCRKWSVFFNLFQKEEGRRGRRRRRERGGGGGRGGVGGRRRDRGNKGRGRKRGRMRKRRGRRKGKGRRGKGKGRRGGGGRDFRLRERVLYRVFYEEMKTLSKFIYKREETKRGLLIYSGIHG